MIEPRNAAFVLIDMQRGFLDGNSSLCIAGAAATVPACSRALNAARDMGMVVVHAVRSYSPDGSDVEPSRYFTWLKDRALSSSRDREEVPGLEPVEGDVVIVKPSFSAFFGTGLLDRLVGDGISTVVLAGTTTPNCIRSTCYDALSCGLNVVILEDCTSSRNPEVQASNIADMAFAGASILSCSDFCADGLDRVNDVAARVRQSVARGDSLGMPMR